MGEYHDKMISFEKEVIFSYKDLLQRPIDVAEITFMKYSTCMLTREYNIW